MYQQDLGGGNAVLFKRIFVTLHQYRLPHRCSGLQLVQQMRTGGPAQSDDARGNRTTGHQHDLAATVAQAHQLFHQRPDDVLIQTATVIREQRTAHLDHPAFGLGDFPTIRHEPASLCQGTYSTSTS